MTDENRDYGDYESKDFTFHLLVLRLLHLFSGFGWSIAVFSRRKQKMESCELSEMKKKSRDELLTVI